jgi:hypothetical protein
MWVLTTFSLAFSRYVLQSAHPGRSVSLTCQNSIALFLVLSTGGRCFKIGVPVHHVAQPEAPVKGEQADYSVEWEDGDPEPVHVRVVDHLQASFPFDEGLQRPTNQFSTLFPMIPPEFAGQ